MEAQAAIETEPAPLGDLLYGVPAIGEFLGLTARQARHLCEVGRVPTFKVGKMICSRRTMLSTWLDEQEAHCNGGNSTE